ncbi:hypothetical protein NPS01_31070 [Nocardioides psychrotolerans]|uniref:Glycosyl transferase family 2 n=1 Tax=Nocardioides psychrotolerans TaxID=1005945 RepID=A0A1I3NJC4_9ACTN|nr:hypothetical protein [Nocardioides psychrotolerans]GEP39444.1 hypothetical protein NPS01_31070 [Nocardioides psychrotolerans]SFJ08846.1 hypothetical protein SAMN05216561_11811 [Nocardioides psychrotolerans]
MKSLGALVVSPAQCTVVTELMPGWGSLWAQRLRWQRGALENHGTDGTTPQTFRHWAQQRGIGYGVVALGAYLLLVLVMALSLDRWVWFPFWFGVGLLFMIERVLTVWRGGWRARLLGATLFPELLFSAFLCTVHTRGIVDIWLGREASRRHAPTPVAEPLDRPGAP